MSRYRKTIRTTITIVALSFASFVLYANWSAPTPGERIYLSHPTGIALLRLSGPLSRDQKAALSFLLQHSMGISSFTLNEQTGSLAITYDPSVTDRAQILHTVQSEYTQAQPLSLNRGTGPECPVHSYLYAWKKIRYTFNFR